MQAVAGNSGVFVDIKQQQNIFPTGERKGQVKFTQYWN